MYQAGLVGLPSPEKRARTNYPSPGVFTTARIWPKQDCHRRCARGRNERWATSIFNPYLGKIRLSSDHE